MHLNLSDKRLFNNLFFDLKKCIKRYVIAYGGKGSGKSYSKVQHLLTQALSSKCRILVIRKTSASLDESVVGLIKSVLSFWQLDNYYTLNKSEKKFYFKNGSEIICKGCDDPEKLKSIFDINSAWIEEASELEEEDFFEINSRIRGKHIKNQQITLTFNPISETHWLKKLFFDEDIFKEDTATFKTTCLDNKFIDKNYIKQLEALKEYDYNRYRIEYLGEWGKIASGGEMYHHFKPEKIVSNVDYNENLPLHVSFDENVNPYLTCLISQIEDNQIRIIDEICIPDFDLHQVCEELKMRYSSHVSGLFIYGDATSRKRDVKGASFYDLIHLYLIEYHPDFRVQYSNPSVSIVCSFVNRLFFDDSDVQIRINSKCTELIKDLENVKKAPDGGKDKRIKRNRTTGVSYQEFGHCTDAMNYLISSAFAESFAKFQYGNSSFQPIFINRKYSKGMKY